MEAYAPPPAPPPVARPPVEPVMARLDDKLAALEAAGYRILWIAISEEELVQLLIEGGEQAVLMDPDPSRDVAWYKTYEIRPSDKPGLRVYLEGEYDEMSCHYA
jgi:hypothetical protein